MAAKFLVTLFGLALIVAVNIYFFGGRKRKGRADRRRGAGGV